MEYINNMLPTSDIFYYATNQISKAKFKSFISNILMNVISVIKIARMSTQETRKREDESKPCDVTNACCCELLDCTSAPLWAQEPYVTGGYLPQDQSVRYYLRALYIRNYELMNVWTNLVPMFVYIYMLQKFNQEMDLVKAWPLLIIICSSIICMLFSALAHLFHSKSETWHRNCFLLDYFGIMIYASCSTMADWFASSTLYHYNIMKSSNLSILMSIANTGFMCLAATKMDIPLLRAPVMQRIVKVGASTIGYVYGMIPVFYRMWRLEMHDEVVLYHSLQFFFMICNPILFASDFPQKYWPGKFNTFLHSHQLFHISVALSCLFNILAIRADVRDGMFRVLSTQPDYPPLSDVVQVMTYMVISCSLTIVLVNLRVRKMNN